MPDLSRYVVLTHDNLSWPMVWDENLSNRALNTEYRCGRECHYRKLDSDEEVQELGGVLYLMWIEGESTEPDEHPDPYPDPVEGEMYRQQDTQDAAVYVAILLDEESR